MSQYKPLGPGTAQIRLFTLLPGDHDDEIRGTLQPALLDNKPAFEALSYTWGDPSVTTPIQVDGSSLAVTTNLESALRDLRQLQNACVLWIDAICINQVDTQEKNHQVPLMGRIYSSAASVIAWLGPSNPRIERYISWVQTYVEGSTPITNCWLEFDAEFDSIGEFERDWAIVETMEGILDIWSSPYWSRMWTFQEYWLPRQEPLCLCGRISFHATKLNFQQIRSLYDESSQRLMLGLDGDADLRRLELSALKMRQRTQLVLAGSMAVRALPRPHSEEDYPMLVLMVLTWKRKCHDPRDKVFALYGMVPEAQREYPADYTKPVENVMLEAACFLVGHDKFEMILNGKSFGFYDDRLSKNSLHPSWMPDFANIPTGIRADRARRLASPLATQIIGLRTVFSPDLLTLSLFARNLGACYFTFEFATSPRQVAMQIYKIANPDDSSEAEAIFGSFCVGILGGDTRKRKLRMAQALVGDCLHDPTASRFLSSEEWLEICEQTSWGTQWPAALDGSTWLMIQKALDQLAGRTALVIEGGGFGVGVAGIKAGDILVNYPSKDPQDSRLVFLTRELWSSSSQPTYYRLVGLAEVDSLVEGDFLDAGLVAELAEREIEEFMIH